MGTYITFGGIAGGIFFQEFELLHEATSVGYGGWALYVAGMLMVLYGLYLISIDSARISVVSSVVGGGSGDHLEGGAKTSGGAQGGAQADQEGELFTDGFTDGFARRRLRFEGVRVGVGTGTASEETALPHGAVVGAKDETDPERTISTSSTSSESTATESPTTLSEALAAALPLKVLMPTATSPSGSRHSSFHGLSQQTDRENVPEKLREKSLSRNPTPSELIHELLHNPAPSLLPSPFTVYGMASGEGRSPNSGHNPNLGPNLGHKPNESAVMARRWGDGGEMAGRWGDGGENAALGFPHQAGSGLMGGGAAALEPNTAPEPNTALEPANRTDRTEPTESPTFSAMVTSIPSSTSSNGSKDSSNGSKDSSNGPNGVLKDSSKGARGGATLRSTLLASVLGWGSKRATSSTRDPSRDWGDAAKSGGRATNTALFTVSEYERKDRVGRSSELSA